MADQAYEVKLKKGVATKGVRVYASSSANAQYKATSKNPGWEVVDIQSK